MNVRKRVIYSILALLTVAFFIGCKVSYFVAFNGGSSFLFVRITDAKPVLPSETEAVFVTFEELSVHKEGGEWITLALVRAPFAIDLLKFHSGKTTELVRPVPLEPGPYDRLRLSISSAAVLRNGSFYAVAIPSENLVIEMDFFFYLEGADSPPIQRIAALDIRNRIIGQPLDEKNCREALYRRKL